MDYEKFIPARIQQLRNQKAVSAYIMSYEVGKGKNYIKNIESGQSKPSWPMFFCICEYLEVTPAEFFDAENVSPKETRDLITVIKKLKEENRQMILTLSQNLEKGQ